MVREAPIGRRIPGPTTPTTAVALMVLCQNSISPYLRTLTILNNIGRGRKRTSHNAGLLIRCPERHDAGGSHTFGGKGHHMSTIVMRVSPTCSTETSNSQAW